MIKNWKLKNYLQEGLGFRVLGLGHMGVALDE